MIVNLLALMAVGAPCGIRIIDTDDPVIAGRAAEAVMRAVETHAHAVRLPGEARCPQHEEACAADTRRELGVQDVILFACSWA